MYVNQLINNDMKRLGLAIVMGFLMVFAMQAEKKEAKIKFESTTFDFGNIKEDGGKVSCEFEFENIGDVPLTILSARAECGCTKPEYPKDEIAPGSKGVIKVTYNPYGRPGGFIKKVTVETDGFPKKINLKIRGSVIPR